MVKADEVDVRPPTFQQDDALYVVDDDVIIVKTEECEHRRVFCKSSKPPPPSMEPIRITLSSESDEDSDHDEGIPGNWKTNLDSVLWHLMYGILERFTFIAFPRYDAI